jgi:hypothetical protein
MSSQQEPTTGDPFEYVDLWCDSRLQKVLLYASQLINSDL